MIKNIYIAVFVCAFVLLIIIKPVWAQSPADGIPAGGIDLTGYAWSDNIGWISLSGTASDGSSYGVRINDDSTVTGYAWSENIGWVQFGGLSNFPGPGGNAAVVGTFPDLQMRGWARACAGTANTERTTMTDANGGWDGWISLSGTASDGSPYGVVFNSGAGSSFAWGSDVIGWISWPGVFTDAGLDPADHGSTGSTGPTDDITIDAASGSADPLNLNTVTGIYSEVSYNININGIPSGETVAYTLKISGATPDITGDVSTNGNLHIVANDIPYTSNNFTIEIDMPAPGVVDESDEVNISSGFVSMVTPDPEINLSVSEDIIQRGEAADISASISATYDVVGCSLRGPGIDETFDLLGGLPGAPMTWNYSGPDPVLNSTGEFTLACPSALLEESITVEVVPTFQEV